MTLLFRLVISVTPNILPDYFPVSPLSLVRIGYDLEVWKQALTSVCSNAPTYVMSTYVIPHLRRLPPPPALSRLSQGHKYWSCQVAEIPWSGDRPPPFVEVQKQKPIKKHTRQNVDHMILMV